MTTNNIDLQPLKELLSDPKHWTQKAFARNEKGESVGPSEEEAVCWCLDGALLRLYPRGTAYEAYHRTSTYLENVLRKTHGHGRLIPFNDASTHAELCAFIDKAIELQGKNEETLGSVG